MDTGDGKAGGISVIQRMDNGDKHTQYRMDINCNHTPAVQFVTLVYKLAHLFLGHLGSDEALRVA